MSTCGTQMAVQGEMLREHVLFGGRIVPTV